MALRTIIQFGDNMLRKKAREITEFDDKLWVLLDDMNETMQNLDGVGLAAPQVGILRRAVVIDAGDEIIEMINPVIVSTKGKQREIEGCLSSRGEWGYVDRPLIVKVRYLNRYGREEECEGDGLLAVAFCHEIDHLNGIIFTDLANEILTSEEVEEIRRKKERKRNRR